MAYFKQLIGKKVYLSPPDLNDAEKYCKWLNSLEISKNLDAEVSITVENEREILSKLIKENKIFGIIENASDKLIGSVGLHDLDYVNGTALFGIFIGDNENQNKGMGTEATQLILDFGFNILNLHNIYLDVYEYNNHAIRCYEKVGFKQIGKLREARNIAGKRYDIIYMDILKSEFESLYVKSIVDGPDSTKK